MVNPVAPEAVLPALAVLTPAVTAFALPLAHIAGLGRRGVEALALLSSIVTGFFSVKLLAAVLSDGTPLTYCFGGWPPPLGIFYEVDVTSALLGCLTACLMFLIVLFSVGYMEDDGRLYLYYTLLMVVEAGMLGCFYTGDFFNLFVMIEVTAISSYALVSYLRSDRVAVAASLKYAVYGALATTAYFAATVFAYGSMGTLNMADMHAKIAGIPTPLTGTGFANVGLGLLVFVALALYAFTYKSALFPNHFWLPEAHSSAPTPVSALLSGLVVNVGIYAIVRFTYTVIGGASAVGKYLPIALLATGAASAVIGGLLMNLQRDVKRLIAYSTVMNLGFIALGYGLSTDLGVAAATYHLVTHAVAKAMLFMSAGLAIACVGSRNLSDLEGVGRASPFIGFMIGVSTLTLAGVPPLSVFMSEYALITAMVRAGNYFALAAFLTAYVSGAVAYLKLLYVTCVKPPRKPRAEVRGRGATYSVLTILAVACVALGLLAPLIFRNVFMPASHTLMNPSQYLKAFLHYASTLTSYSP